LRPDERLYLAVSGGLPDRVPFMPKIWIDLAAALLGEDLLEVAGDPARALEITARAAVELGLDGARLFHLPARRLGRAADGQAVELDAKSRLVGRVDEAGGLSTRLEDPSCFDLRDPRFTTAPQFFSSDGPFVRDLADARALAVPGADYWEESGAARRTRAVMHAYGGRVALAGDLGTATFSFCAALRGLERTMFDLTDDPALVHAMMDRGAEIAIEKARFNLGLGIRILRLNDSAGTMSLVSPATWREFVLPRFRAICAAVKTIDPAALVYCHICGDVRPIATDLVESGIACIGPLDPLGSSTPEALRALVGDRVALMGGIDTLTFLRGDPAEVAAEARARIRGGGRSGGFVLGSGCVVPRDSPRAGIEAARDVARATSYSNGGLRFVEDRSKEYL
jgi:hypothetical protein